MNLCTVTPKQMENVLYKVEGMEIPSLSTICIKVDTLDLWDDQIYELESIADTQSSLDTQFEFLEDEVMETHSADTQSDMLIAELILDCDELDIPSLDEQDTIFEPTVAHVEELEELEEFEAMQDTLSHTTQNISHSDTTIEDELQVETYRDITFEQTTPIVTKPPIVDKLDIPKPIQDKVQSKNQTLPSKTHPSTPTAQTLTQHVPEDVQSNNNDLVTTITEESKPNYSGMSIEELQQHVKVFMHEHGVKEAPVPTSLVENEFGARNVLKLTRNLYLLQRKDGYTMSR